MTPLASGHLHRLCHTHPSNTRNCVHDEPMLKGTFCTGNQLHNALLRKAHHPHLSVAMHFHTDKEMLNRLARSPHYQHFILIVSILSMTAFFTSALVGAPQTNNESPRTSWTVRIHCLLLATSTKYLAYTLGVMFLRPQFKKRRCNGDQANCSMRSNRKIKLLTHVRS